MLALILDDSEMNNLLIMQALKPVADCEPVAFTCPVTALDFLRAHVDRIGVVVTDYDMPGLTGLEVIAAARAVPGFAHVPIVMVTSLDQRSLRHEALRAGATDFLGKPCDPVEIQARITNLMKISAAHRQEQDRAAWLAREVAAAVAVIEAREREIIALLMRAAEHRDTDTGDHIARVAGYVGVIARNLGFGPEEIRILKLASTMHDVGKIGVPDAILLKPGPLSAEERAEMEKHAERGRRILEGSTSDVVRLAAEIAESHHERWDGTGYPKGLRGEGIPLSGRIVAVADVFDALVTERPYKAAWTLERARAFVADQAGRHFDPRCVEAFLAGWDAVARTCLRAAA
ncbi:putative two-component system response regulator [Methylobacterium sp. 275MFSha3.1]|uniref:HD-GYP domain-containing protein n=1 Tax=Methylobacterium sp. 275MFSha3.1 TaxID=1502746 RepID=UPI0008A7F62D|nr:HD domain-containing phosphohydrolase [Methylobacterium sp. 275MFSha3.1]SEH53982.1 putative two-component system response regulator [Methylobacterium sp. 275MFSha3.1]